MAVAVVALALVGGAVYGATGATGAKSARTAVAQPIAEPDAPESVTEPSHAPAVVNDPAAVHGTALAVLAALPVKGRAAKTGYDRVGQFGTAWLDVDRNGCDTRNDILARDLHPAVKSGPCTVTSGTLHDPYTGATIAFVRGNTTSLAVQIDHVVPLLNAWETGAQQLTEAQRSTLANDPLNLLAVDGAANDQKGAGDAATWLPSNTAFRCAYVARQVSVKATYGLWVTRPEHDAIERILTTCPAELAPSSAFAPEPRPAAPATTAPVPATSAPAPPAAVPSAPAPQPVVSYANCAAVRAAGKAPLHAGDPGYSRKLDRDGDGVACE